MGRKSLARPREQGGVAVVASPKRVPLAEPTSGPNTMVGAFLNTIVRTFSGP